MQKRTVLITGASSGIGQACAQLLSQSDDRFTVYGTSRHPKNPAFFPFKMIEMDVTSDLSVGKGINKVLNETGRLDVLVNNAGYGITARVEDIPIEESIRLYDTNLVGMIRTCREAVPFMRKQGGGLIINMSSQAGTFGLPYRTDYSASKAAIDNWSKNARREFRRYGIDVVVVRPGNIATPFTQNSCVIPCADEVFNFVVQKYVLDESRGPHPDRVAETVRKAIESEHPRKVYDVLGLRERCLVSLGNRLPDCLKEIMVAYHYGLNGLKQ
ncbi:MAG: SDR family NAD(P)-dependent oxidoreductase [Candidatus Woesearchaeota archaeon]